MLSNKDIAVKALPFMIVGLIVWSIVYELIPHTGLIAMVDAYSFGAYCLFVLWRIGIRDIKKNKIKRIDTIIPKQESND